MNRTKDICERTFNFAIRVISICRFLGKNSDVSRMLGKQLFRAGTSIGSNIEEAQGGQSRADFISKISIARKEARETLYWLRLLSEAKFISPGKLNDITSECNELISILTAIIKKTQKS